MKDLVIVCSDCGEEFTFDKGEQEYYKKNHLHFPKRCKNCRKAKRVSHEEGSEDISLDNVQKYVSKQQSSDDSIDYSIYGYYR